MIDTASTKRRIRSALVGISLVASLAGIAACTEEKTPAAAKKTATASASPATKPSAPAATSTLHMITNGDHKLAFHVIAGTLPALVLDAGGGEDSTHWTTMAPALARKTGSMVVTYDRAGLGKSDEVPGPWKVDNAVADLKTGLATLGITHDIVLVSHSQAGEVATYFAKKNPTWVSGAVLMDANLPPFFTDNEVARIVAANKAQIAALKDKPSTKQTRQLQATAANYGPDHRAYHKVAWPTSIPATVVVSEKTPFPTTQDAQHWRDAAQQFVDAAPNRNLVTADGSSHNIAGDRPDIVINAVDKMLTTLN